MLDYVPNPRPGALYLVRFAAPEFTSLCPVTGQPDFAHLVIDYAPGETIVESKSLKLFLAAFRNHAGFHEDVTVGIGQRLAAEMKPRWLRIGGYWYPRGGIPIDVFWQSGAPPDGPLDSRPGRRALSRAGADLQIVVHGAGSIGCYVGGAWLAAGLDVSFLGRERVERGDRRARPDAQRHRRLARRARARPDPLRDRAGRRSREADIVALCVKSIGTEAAARRSPPRPGGAAVISFQNGISNAETLRRLLPRRQVVQGMVPYNVVHLGPGRWHRATWGDLTAEDNDGDPRALASDRRPARPPAPARTTWRRVPGASLLFNLNNAINALVRPHHPRGTEAARLSPGVRGRDRSRCSTCSTSPGSSPPRSAGRAAPARPRDRRARLPLQQPVPQDPEDRPQGPRLDGRRFRRRPPDRDRLSERRGGAARRSGSAARRRSTRRSSTWSSRPSSASSGCGAPTRARVWASRARIFV